MKNYAIIQNNFVINNIIAENIEIAKAIFPEYEIIELSDNFYISVGFEKINNFWRPPMPHDGWVFDEEMSMWIPPIPYPQDGNVYGWNEDIKMWVVM